MNSAPLRSLLTLAFLLVGFTVRGELKVGDKAKVRIQDLRPTQFAVGMTEVESRQNALAFEKEKGEESFRDYLKGKRKLAAIGPGGQLYLVDGHHLALALDRSGFDSIYIEVIADYSQLTETDFWEKMQKKGYAYLRDENGKKKPASALPTEVKGLKNDPYRSLAWMLETLGAYEKIERPFHEFEWAELLRDEMKIRGDSPKDWKRAVEKGWKIVTGKLAKKIPGYIGDKAENCNFSWKKLGLKPPAS